MLSSLQALEGLERVEQGLWAVPWRLDAAAFAMDTSAMKERLLAAVANRVRAVSAAFADQLKARMDELALLVDSPLGKRDGPL